MVSLGDWRPLKKEASHHESIFFASEVEYSASGSSNPKQLPEPPAYTPLFGGCLRSTSAYGSISNHQIAVLSYCKYLFIGNTEFSLLNVETRSMKNVFKIALLNTLLFGFLQASSALAVEQKTYLATEAGESEIQFSAEDESVVLGLYYHPTPEEGTTGVGVVVNFDHTVFDASY